MCIFYAVLPLALILAAVFPDLHVNDGIVQVVWINSERGKQPGRPRRLSLLPAEGKESEFWGHRSQVAGSIMPQSVELCSLW